MTFDEAKDEAVTIEQAVELLKPDGPSELAIRKAINAGVLPVFGPGGKKADTPEARTKLGAGVKVRIWKRDLQQWWFGVAPR